MKTAMQEAIDYLREFNLEASAIILEDKFLEKEKEQIMNAYLKGDNNGCGCYDFSTPIDARNYYNETFNQNK